jgi:hypothetical protein
MALRIPSALMSLWFAVFVIMSTHFFLDDLSVTTATSEKLHTGNPVFIILDIFCMTIATVGVAAFISLCWHGEQRHPQRF